MTTLRPSLSTLCAVALLNAASGSALAAEPGGLRPVSSNLFRKAEMLELSPFAGASLADAFFQKYALGVRASWHLNESFSLGAHGSFVFNTPAGAVNVCRSDAGCRTPTVGELRDVPGRLGLIAGGEVGWSPLYGKVSLFSEKMLHFDLGLTGGIGAVQYQAPGGKGRIAPAAHVGVAQRIRLGHELMLRLDLRDYLYQAEIASLGTTNHKVESQLLFEVGLSFFLLGESGRR